MRRRLRHLRSIVLIVAGVLVLLTPVVLTHLKNVEQHDRAAAYSHQVAQLQDREREDRLAAARAYNAELPPVGAPDPWTNGIDTTSPAYRRYREQLDVGSVMSRLKIPSVGMDLPVYHGTSQQVLAAGVGHLYGTALPVGGEGTHTVLTGHTGLATLTMFDNLTHVKEGDIIIIETLGQTLAYRVTEILTVLPDQIDAIRPQAGHDLVTLVTCTPYGINSHRLLVRGERVAVPQSLPGQTYHSPWQPWMVAAVAMASLALLYLIVLLVRRHRREQERARAKEVAS